MVLNLIGLDTVKTELGISDSGQDAAITAMIPKVSADVRRILNCQYDEYITASFDETADTVDLYTPQSLYPDYPVTPLEMGQVLHHPNLATDTYITGYNFSTGLYSLNATPSDSGDYVYPTLNISQWSAVSRMIWYKIGKLTTNNVDAKDVASKSIGSVSVSYTDAEINSKWGYPQAILNDLGAPFSEVG